MARLSFYESLPKPVFDSRNVSQIHPSLSGLPLSPALLCRSENSSGAGSDANSKQIGAFHQKSSFYFFIFFVSAPWQIWTFNRFEADSFFFSRFVDSLALRNTSAPEKEEACPYPGGEFLQELRRLCSVLAAGLLGDE